MEASSQITVSHTRSSNLLYPLAPLKPSKERRAIVEMMQHLSSSYAVDSRSMTISSSLSSAVDTNRYSQGHSPLLFSCIFRANSSHAVFVGAKTRILHDFSPFIKEIIFWAMVVVLPVPGGPKMNLILSSRFSFRLNPGSSSRPLNAVRSFPIRSIWFFRVIEARVHLLHSILLRIDSYILLAFSRRLLSLTLATSNFNFISSRLEKLHFTYMSPTSSNHMGIPREGFSNT